MYLPARISFELSGAISSVLTGAVVALFTPAKDIDDEHHAQNEQQMNLHDLVWE